ncbi:MAG TPA: flavodoxin family protein [Kiloniellales bacterium]|nr:flavodoxin family protein [Kiloniellales bacterium]
MSAVAAPAPRKGMPSPELDEATFKQRYLQQFRDPGYEPLQGELARIAEAAWQAYSAGRKAPQTRKAGPEFADPDYDLSVDWLAARDAIKAAQQRHDDKTGPDRFLLINGSSRSEHTCPGEMSKTWRLLEIARQILEGEGGQVQVLDLARLASEYGRRIYPCKACFSTAAPLCHWPCSCYPNHGLGQTQDWMNDIFPLWIEAHGVLLLTPVNWFHSSSSMKLMIDRLVCADGGNPDPTLTQGKDAAKAKQIEMAGWHYPRPLAGRRFGVVVHADAEGAENLRRQLADWLSTMGLESAGTKAELDRYVGYWEPYATNHQALDADAAFQQEVRNVALLLSRSVRDWRSGRLPAARSLELPRDK